MTGSTSCNHITRLAFVHVTPFTGLASAINRPCFVPLCYRQSCVSSLHNQRHPKSPLHNGYRHSKDDFSNLSRIGFCFLTEMRRGCSSTVRVSSAYNEILLVQVLGDGEPIASSGGLGCLRRIGYGRRLCQVGEPLLAANDQAHVVQEHLQSLHLSSSPLAAARAMD